MGHLKAAGYTPFCLFGHSRGANNALLYASTRSANDDDRACAETVFASLNALSISGDSSASASTTTAAGGAATGDSATGSDSTAAASAVSVSDDVLLNPTKLAIVVAAPRFHMPNMLTTLFPPEKVSLLEEHGQFPWNEEIGTYVTQADADVVCKQMDMTKTLEAIPAHVPILLLHGTDDELIPLADAEAYKAARPTIDLTVVDGARHAFRGKKQLKVLLTKCSEWIGTEAKRLLD
jgi:pimeloyl-ACP methyl ester carboxylesterase